MPVAQQVRRLGRVSRGLVHAETRPAYLAQVRRSLRANDDRQRCRACGGRRVTRERKTFFKDSQKSFVVELCRDCSYVGNPDNFNDYTVYESVEQFPSSARVGTAQQPGREYFMAVMGRDILNHRDISVLIVGPGASLDYQHIGALDNIGRVAIGDVVRLHDVPDFVDLKRPQRQRFDLVLASEVIEHFVDPARDFPGLFRMLRRDGLLICSTNVYDGGNLNRHEYLYIKGHTSYYSSNALRHIASTNRMSVDFRVPRVASRLGPRKRYVFFTKTHGRMQDVAQYFGGHQYAPSEE